MTCPPDAARVLLQILEVALLQIRSRGWQGDGLRCAVEADHVHNLPALLSNYSDELLRFYWDVERPSFMKRCAPADLAGYEPLWDQLAELVQTVSQSGLLNDRRHSINRHEIAEGARLDRNITPPPFRRALVDIGCLRVAAVRGHLSRRDKQRP